LHILLAEDNQVNRVIVTRLLEKRGHTLVTVENGREAVTAVETQDFDLVLLDVQMPVMDGLQAVGLIRRREEETGKSHVPVIALTAHAMQGDRERCLAAGMDDYLSKPINREDLFRVIERMVQSNLAARIPGLPHDNDPLPGGPLSP
jgi:CheY-like chemotaxis protein